MLNVYGFKNFILIFFALLISSCGSTHGVLEFQQYTQAFDLQLEAGGTVLDSVARAERIVALRRIKRRGNIPKFELNEAAYWVDTVQPPITASIRSSLNVLKSYNDALGSLANGEAADALAARLGKLTTQISSTGLALASAFAGPTVVQGSDILIKKLTDNVGILSVIFKATLVRKGREQFRSQLIKAAPDMEKFLIDLRNSTPVLFELLKRGRVKRGSFDGNLGMSTASLKELERERSLLAGWVLLMEKTLIAMKAALVAATAERSSLQTSAAISEAAIELRVVAEQIKSIRSKP